MNKIDRYIGIALFSFGIIICIKSFAYPFGSLRSPGAGFFPLFFSVLLMTLATTIVVNTFLGGNGKLAAIPFFTSNAGSRRIVFAILSLLGFRYVLPLIGLAPTTFLFIFFLGKYLAHYDWEINGSLALTAAVVSYFIFQLLLKIPFPSGIFGF